MRISDWSSVVCSSDLRVRSDTSGSQENFAEFTVTPELRRQIDFLSYNRSEISSSRIAHFLQVASCTANAAKEDFHCCRQLNEFREIFRRNQDSEIDITTTAYVQRAADSLVKRQEALFTICCLFTEYAHVAFVK